MPAKGSRVSNSLSASASLRSSTSTGTSSPAMMSARRCPSISSRRPSGSSRARRASAFPISPNRPRRALACTLGWVRQFLGLGTRSLAQNPSQLHNSIPNFHRALPSISLNARPPSSGCSRRDSVVHQAPGPKRRLLMSFPSWRSFLSSSESPSSSAKRGSYLPVRVLTNIKPHSWRWEAR